MPGRHRGADPADRAHPPRQGPARGSVNPRGLTLLGAFLGASSGNVGTPTASAFSIVVPSSPLAACCIGYIETVTAYLVSPSLRNIPALILLVAVVWVRPQGFLARR